MDWWEWGPDAFAAAKRRDVPVLLSVGYSACHWCHVMAHESFEDPATAAIMNDRFVNVKVDREERPDVDRIYMDAVQAMTGRGGWPMTVFLTPAGKPFYAGTYFPKDDLHGHPSFTRVLLGVSEAWQERRGELDEQAERLTEAITRSLPPGDLPGSDVVTAAFAQLQATYDAEHGGFGGAPKFPQAPTLELLLRLAGHEPEAASMLEYTLERMARGGIYDHVGGGFARYAVDRIWLVPHFEKMLYDNALLARVYLRAGQVLDRGDFHEVAVDILEYVLRDMTHADGGWYSAEDADSEGVEGKFYVWSRTEFDDVAQEVAGEAAAAVAEHLGVTEQGNFEGATILHRAVAVEEVAAAHSVDIEELRRTTEAILLALRVRRDARVRPGLDDKVITAWNGLALRAFAEAGAVLDEPRYLDAARANARFVLRRLRRDDGRLHRSWRAGNATVLGFCDDYAAYALGLYTLYAATGEAEWFTAAEDLVAGMIELFADPEGGFFATGGDAEELITRPKNLMDNPTPSDNALAAEALVVHRAYTGAGGDLLEGVLRAAARLLEHYPTAAGHLAAVMETLHRGVKEVAIVGERPETLSRTVWEQFRPGCVLAQGPGPAPLLRDRPPLDAPATAYVCRDFMCERPVTDAERLRELLRS